MRILALKGLFVSQDVIVKFLLSAYQANSLLNFKMYFCGKDFCEEMHFSVLY